MITRRLCFLVLSCLLLLTQPLPATQSPVVLLNVSYDIGRELFRDINAQFEPWWKKKYQQEIHIKQSHAGSTGQARSVVEGLQADVVTFVQWPEIQYLYTAANLLPEDWHQRLPYNSSPYYSIPVFMVREGNPKAIKSWGDLARPGLSLVFPNPSTSGNGRYTWLAAWAWACDQGMTEIQVEEFMRKLLGNIRVFPPGGRAATTTFVNRRQGDVLITFEAEVLALLKMKSVEALDIVVPESTLQADFVVARVNAVTNKRQTSAEADAYLNFLYAEQAQQIIARNYYRVRNHEVMKQWAGQFRQTRLLSVESVYGSWPRATAQFEKGGAFEKLLRERGQLSSKVK
ncbi:thiosulfate ABC transporter substrate-binding protein CysP [Endozoicomonadaceae bacterium StTr2]